MKKLSAALLALSFVLGTAAFAQDAPKTDSTDKTAKKHKSKKPKKDAATTDADKIAK